MTFFYHVSLNDSTETKFQSFTCTGSLLTNGTKVDSKSFRKESAYVMQSDALFPRLTVRETVRYAAYLRVQGKTTEQCNKIAENTIRQLKLTKVVDTIVGNDDIRGLSGGEKRRVSWQTTIIDN